MEKRKEKLKNLKKEIKTGDSVLVKSGVTDPDYEYDIGGWQGRVTHIDSDDGNIFLMIKWDSNTLEQFGYVSSDEQEKNISQILDRKDLSVSEKNQGKFYEYLSEQFKAPCILTGSEDFSWEEPYVMGVFDQKEYEELKKKIKIIN